MKFKKGDKVCALLVCNRWGVDFTCYVGTLVKIEKKSQYANPTATISVTQYIGLETKQKHDAKDFTIDARVFKLLKWDDETKAEVKELRQVSKQLHALTKAIKAK